MKKYVVYGLIEFKCEIRAGVLSIPVEFRGGHVSAYGVTPAEFATSDPVLQRAIESSPHFRSGRIQVISKPKA